MDQRQPTAICEDYLLCTDAGAGYQRNLRGSALRYEAALEAGADPWDYPAMNRYLASLKARQRSPVYINSNRRHLIVLWRHATDSGLADEPIVRKIRLTKVRDQTIPTFSIDQVRSILEASHKITGTYHKIPLAKNLYWPAWIRVKWSTGLRHNDIFSMRRSDIERQEDGKGLAHVIQNKTGKRVTVRLDAKTMEAVAATFIGRAASRELILPWTNCQWTWLNDSRKIIRAAGLTEGNMKWLRASAGSHYENAHPNRGHELLGNDRQTFTRHYRDPNRIKVRRPLAEEL